MPLGSPLGAGLLQIPSNATEPLVSERDTPCRDSPEFITSPTLSATRPHFVYGHWHRVLRAISTSGLTAVRQMSLLKSGGHKT